ncbi:MAG: hypothetical protein Q4E60_08500 [Bacteroidales bacterium]|nr:hypothetical protein [Bacteroidales bacterium]
MKRVSIEKMLYNSVPENLPEGAERFCPGLSEETEERIIRRKTTLKGKRIILRKNRKIKNQKQITSKKQIIFNRKRNNKKGENLISAKRKQILMQM